MSDEHSDRFAEVRLAELVMPNRTNHHGTLFGGHALGLMDHAGWVAATRCARRTMVTVASDRVEFKVPVRAGQLVELVARVTRVGRRSRGYWRRGPGAWVAPHLCHPFGVSPHGGNDEVPVAPLRIGSPGATHDNPRAQIGLFFVVTSIGCNDRKTRTVGAGIAATAGGALHLVGGNDEERDKTPSPLGW